MNLIYLYVYIYNIYLYVYICLYIFSIETSKFYTIRVKLSTNQNDVTENVIRVRENIIEYSWKIRSFLNFVITNIRCFMIFIYHLY